MTFYQSLSQYLEKDGSISQTPSDNIFSPPLFLQKYILSDDMCYILSRLLNPNPAKRYNSLYEVRKILIKLQDNIRTTPILLRNVIGHPIVPQSDSLDSGTEDLSPKKRRKSVEGDDLTVRDFRASKLSEFSLKYLGKFIYESNVMCVRINGGRLPLENIKMNEIVDLNLSKCNLYSEDIFILSMYLKNTNCLKRINLSQNYIGYKYLEEAKVIELKMQNKQKIKEHNFEELFYESLGTEHLSLALSMRPQLEYVDFSDNDIGPQSFKLLMKVFEVNINITYINIADCKINGDTTKEI